MYWPGKINEIGAREMPSKLYPTLTELEPQLKTFKKTHLNNRSGFIIADFLFALVLVIGCGIVIFGLTFSLATVEIAQYIVWSTARNYSAANESESAALQSARNKFKNLADQFPLLTGHGSASPWVTMGDPMIGDLVKLDTDLSNKLAAEKDNKDLGQQFRQPWIGAKSEITLNLLQGIKIPFLGPIATPGSTEFTFPVRAFILRHPSQEECQGFYSEPKRYTEGIQKISGEDFSKIQLVHEIDGTQKYVPIEDNGC